MFVNLDQALQIICKAYPQVIAVYVFGSQANGVSTPDSDLDLAVLLPTKVDTALLWQCGQDIAQVLNMDVDLVDLLQASTVFRYQVVQECKRIYCQDEAFCEQWEHTACAMYLRFNEERREILEDIAARKQVL